MATLELRPRSATEIVDAAFQIIRQNYVPLATLSVASQLPALAMRLSFRGLPTDPAQVMQWMQSEVSWGQLALLGILAFVGQNAVAVAASQVYLGERINSGAAFMRSLMRTGVLLLVWILASFAVGLGFIFLVIPGIWIALRLIPLFNVTVLEDGGPFRIMKRTWELGRGHVGHMFLTVLLAILIYFGVAVIGAVVVGILAAMVSVFRDPTVGAILSTAVSAAIFPLFMMMQVILYYDLRIRYEGFDVEMMSRDLGAPAARA